LEAALQQLAAIAMDLQKEAKELESSRSRVAIASTRGRVRSPIEDLQAASPISLP
jgi:type VI protein secretion system component VasF